MIKYKQYEDFKKKINSIIIEEKFKNIINRLINDVINKIFEPNASLNGNFLFKVDNIIIEINKNFISFEEKTDSTINKGKYYTEKGNIITEYNKKIENLDEIIIQNEKIVFDKKARQNYYLKKYDCKRKKYENLTEKDLLNSDCIVTEECIKVDDTVWIKIEKLDYYNENMKKNNTIKYYIKYNNSYILMTDEEKEKYKKYLLEENNTKEKGKK